MVFLIELAWVGGFLGRDEMPDHFDLVASMEGGILVVSGRGTQPSGARQLQRIR